MLIQTLLYVCQSHFLTKHEDKVIDETCYVTWSTSVWYLSAWLLHSFSSSLLADSIKKLEDPITLWSRGTGCCNKRQESNTDENVFSTKAPQMDQVYITRFNPDEQHILIPYIWKIPLLTLYCVSNNKH